MTQDQALDVLKTGVNVFLTGEPGSGKTYTINQYGEWLFSKYQQVAVTASTGIAATHINGKTIHSWSGLGIKENVTDADIRKIMEKGYAVRQMVQADVLIIDEISMLNANALDNIDRILRHVRGTALTGEPFGGLQVVFVGDFFQLPPVTKKGEVRFAFESQTWIDAAPKVCYLTEQHRQSDAQFLEILTAMRQGKITPAHTSVLRAHKDRTLDMATELYTHNADVDEVNDAALAELDDEEYSFRMQEEGIPFLVELIKKNCMSPSLLTLKRGALVMFTRNNFDEGYVNGTLGIVNDFTQGYDPLPIIHTRDGARIIAKRAEWSIKHNDGQKGACVRQIPLRLAWAITVHKSQGMSLDAAKMDLSSAFEYGQGYVAISRVRTLDGLSLEGFNAHALKMHPKVVKRDAVFRSESDATGAWYAGLSEVEKAGLQNAFLHG